MAVSTLKGPRENQCQVGKDHQHRQYGQMIPLLIHHHEHSATGISKSLISIACCLSNTYFKHFDDPVHELVDTSQTVDKKGGENAESSRSEEESPDHGQNRLSSPQVSKRQIRDHTEEGGSSPAVAPFSSDV